MYFLLILDIWNGLIGFTLFIMGNIASVFVQFGFRQTLLNGLITKIKVPLLYFNVRLINQVYFKL